MVGSSYNLISGVYMMLITRFWGSATALLCALLLQNCQSNSVSVRATEGEEPVANPPSVSAMRRCALSEPLAMMSLTSPVVHVASSRFPTTPAHKEVLSAVPLVRSLSSPVRHILATVSNSLRAPCNSPTAAMHRVPHAVPLGNTTDHVLSLDGSRACGSKVEKALGEMPSDEEGSKPPTQQEPSDLDDELARKKTCDGEGREHRDIRRDVLGILLAMAGSEPGEATAFLDVLLVAAQDNNCRQQALEALGKMGKASPDMLSECFPSLRAAARIGDKNVRLLALKTLAEMEWKHYFGEVGPAPDLPDHMAAILDGACPFWPEKQVKDTHLLVLIPATVDGQPFTLDLLKELIGSSKNGGHSTKYRYYNSDVREQIGSGAPAASYWLLMTHDVLPESRSKMYANQEKLVADHAKRASMPYELPKALEAVTVIVMHHARNGERLYSDSPWTFTRCQELVRSPFGEYPAVVGGFEPSGLYVSHCSYGNHVDGVAGCQKF
jgi:hypothetical protein